MALKKTYTLPNGVQGEYWKVGKGNTVELPRLTYLKDQNKIHGYFDLCLYVNEESRNAAPSMPIMEWRVHFTFDVTNYQTLSIPMEDIYNYIKTEWKIYHTEQNGVDENGLPIYVEVADFDLSDAVDV